MTIRSVSLVVISVLVGALLGTTLERMPAQGQQAGITGQVLQRGTIRIATTGGNPPYSQLTAGGTPEGYDIDIGKAIADTLKVKPEFIITDIPGRIALLQTRKADITIADFTKTVMRSTTIAFTDPYLVAGLQFLVLNNRGDLKTVADLNNAKIKIGITRGGTAEQNVPLAAPNATIARFDNETDELLALKSRQIDVMSQDNLYNADLIKKQPGQYKVLPGLYSREEIAIGLPAGDFDWWRMINTWAGQFNASGDNARLFKHWFGYDLPRIQTPY